MTLRRNSKIYYYYIIIFKLLFESKNKIMVYFFIS